MRIIVIILVWIWLFGCTQTGYVKVGVWPRHNEDILSIHGGVNKSKFEISETIKVDRVSIQLNPVVIGGGVWPRQTQSYQVDWVDLEANVVFKFHLDDRIEVYYHKKRYFELYNRAEAYPCNCTYANEVGVIIKW